MACNDYCDFEDRRMDNSGSYNVSCKFEYNNRLAGGRNLTALVHCSDMCYFCTTETKQDCGDLTPTDAYASFQKLVDHNFNFGTVHFNKPLYLTCPPPPTKFFVLYVLIPSMLLPIIFLISMWWRTVYKEKNKLSRLLKGDFEEHDYYSLASHEEEPIAPFLGSLPRSSMNSDPSSRGSSLSKSSSTRGYLEDPENQAGRPSEDSSTFSVESQFMEGAQKDSIGRGEVDGEDGKDLEGSTPTRRTPEDIVSRQKMKLKKAWKSFAIVSVIVVTFVVAVLILCLVHEWWVYPTSGTSAALARNEVRNGCAQNVRENGKGDLENSCI